MLVRLGHQIKSFDEIDAFKIALVTNSLVEGLVDHEKVEQYKQEYSEILHFEINDDIADPQTLGLPDAEQHQAEELGKRFIEVLNQISDESGNSEKELRKWAKESNGIPALLAVPLIRFSTLDYHTTDYRLETRIFQKPNDFS